ncbi:MAG: GNAT family N-acetyltransferase [Deltaproteobacteria bacterium]|nr:GNAT family N-acetyltransferase [Deltaproteobacteria bacterium]MBW2137260.1 GNAT family N-acetyltransferase [Deltaproteobacteria bacterium]
MDGKEYGIRNYTPEDYRRLQKLEKEAKRESRIACAQAAGAALRDLDRPNHSPERDLFIAEQGGQIVGFIDVIPELEIKRAVLNHMVSPGYLKSSLINDLLPPSINRARELGVQSVHINIPEGDTSMEELLLNRSFRYVRCFVEMHMNVEEGHYGAETLPGTTIRQLKRGEEAMLADIQNRSFTGTWGFNPNSVEEILHRIGHPDTSYENVILCLKGERPIAYCWTVLCQSSGRHRERRARIHMLGVDPDCRGKGMGKAILLAGLSHLKSKGFQRVVLTCDSENKAARALYAGAGFEVYSSSRWYEKGAGEPS